MLIGIVGSPNTGKSTFFSATTLVDVSISPRPFTTIKPNLGVTYVRLRCACSEFKTKCNPKNSRCENGIRLVPINVIDVAGLVPGAHLGKGLGNQFLDDLRSADVLIQTIDISGKIDEEGNPCEFYDPINAIVFLEEEIAQWINGIIKRGWNRIKGRGMEEIANILTGLKITKEEIEAAANSLSLSTEGINWREGEILEFAKKIMNISMPIVIAANKIDLPSAKENYEKLVKQFPNKTIIPTYADGELALRKAAAKGIVKYIPGDEKFEIIGGITEGQMAALERFKGVVAAWGGTGVQKVINEAVFEKLKLIAIYPVNDEHKLADHYGNVLPDVIFVKEGSTTIQLAEKIHTDLAKNFIFAIDARKKIRVGRDHILKNGDIIKIVAGKS